VINGEIQADTWNDHVANSDAPSREDVEYLLSVFEQADSVLRLIVPEPLLVGLSQCRGFNDR
jgi:hypothetical protein